MFVWGDEGSGSDVIGCSVRGQKNVDNGVPCQDDNEKRTLPGDKYIIAAADGLGSASHSHVGSNVATTAAVDYLGNTITGSESLNEEALQSTLSESFNYARRQLHQKADSEDLPVSALNTTLLVAVGGPAGVGGAAVGDGGIVGHLGGENGLIIPREDTEYENKTIPLQSDNWEESYRFGWVADADAAAVFSDGLDGVAWEGPASVSDELFNQIFNNIRDYSDLDELEDFLEEFLSGEQFRKSSQDDKTLVVGALPAGQWTDSAAVDLEDTPFVEPPETPNRDTDQVPPDRTPLSPVTTSTSSSTSTSPPTSPAPNRQRRRGHGVERERRDRGPDDQSRGSNRTRHVMTVAIIGGLMIVIMLIAVVFGLFGSSDETTLTVESAELTEDNMLIINGTVAETVDNNTLNLTVSIQEAPPDNGSSAEGQNTNEMLIQDLPETATQTPTDSPTPTATDTQTPTDTPTPTDTQTENQTGTPTPTDNQTQTGTPTPTDDQTGTPTPTDNPTPTPTDRRTETPPFTEVERTVNVSDNGNFSLELDLDNWSSNIAYLEYCKERRQTDYTIVVKPEGGEQTTATINCGFHSPTANSSE